MPSAVPDVSLDGVGFGGGVTDDQEALGLLVAPYSRPEGQDGDPRFGQVQNSHFGLQKYRTKHRAVVFRD
jgi:hypothetical protein